MNLHRETSGVYAVAPTPFQDDGSIDEKAIDGLVDFYESSGVHGITILGQLGEASKLDSSESGRIVRRVLGRTKLPVVIGVTGLSYAAIRSLARNAMDLGAAGILVPPSGSLRTDDEIVDHYMTVSKEIGSDTPFAVQDYPLSTGVRMSVNVIRRLSSMCGNFVMLKHEDWPGLDKISALRELEASGSMTRLSILCGNGGLFLDFELRRGADGAMTGYCFPEMLVDLVEMIKGGRTTAADELFAAHLPLLRYEQQPGVGLAVRKYVFRRRGIITSDRVRLPGSGLTEAGREDVELLLKRLSTVDERVRLKA